MTEARRSRRHTRVVGGLVVGAVLALAGFFVLRGLLEGAASRAAHPSLEGRLRVAGISSPVEIWRDGRGVPHIEAESELDAFFGLGFAHAQDRLGQMTWLVHRARGRSAELIGEAGLEGDRLARTLDLGGLAAAEFEQLDERSRRSLEAYAAGVNARIARLHRGETGSPLLIRNLGAMPQGWQTTDALAVFKLYSWGLSEILDLSMVLDDLIEHLGGFGARRFFPGRRDADAAPAPLRPPTTASAPPVPSRADPLRRTLGLAGRGAGSTAWVLGGAHTRSGLPILVADAHLEPTAPSLLYIAHLRGGRLDVAGATIPGVPVVWTGRNAGVAWASTHARAVTVDLYSETFHPAKEGLYHDGRDWREVSVREETIEVRGREPETLQVRSTHHGPLIHEWLGVEEPVALAWTGARSRPVSGIDTLLRLARAPDAAALLDALADHEEPVLAVVYADDEGAAGMQMAGYVPLRSLFSGLVPVPGRARWYDWQGRVAFSDLPRRKLAGARGWAIASDNDLVAPGQEPRVEWLWRTGARAERIDALLRAAVADGPVDLQTLARLQADVGGARGPELTAIALELMEPGETLGPEAREVVAVLRGWDGQSTPDSVGAAAYHVFLESLTGEVLGPRLGEALLARYLALPQTDPEWVVLEILRGAARGDGRDAWAEPGEVGAAVRRSLREAWFRLSYRMGSNQAKWYWGELHPLRFRPFGPREAGEGDDLGPFPYGGDGSTVVAAEYDPAHGFDVRLASTFRFAVDAGALDQALVAVAPGQSEHPRHPHFRDGLGPWLEARPQILVTGRLLVEQTSPHRLLLEPAVGGSP